MSHPPPSPDDRSAAVVAAYQQQTAATRAQLAAVIVALWRSLPDYRNGSLARFVEQAVPVVTGALGHMQAMSSAYLATLLGLSGGSVTPVATPTLTIGRLRNGADPAEVYGRPFHQVWRMLHDGTPPPDAFRSGESRAVQTAMTDLQLVKTYTSQSVLADSKRVVGYRRVLEGPHSCALCIVASTARYHKAELLPIHPGCDCSVAPIVGESDPGRVINAPLLAAVHDAVFDRFGADSTAARQVRGAVSDTGKPVLYRDILVTHAHGEIGPVLAVRGQSFTGPGDLH